jgi:hypothetical protein
LTFDSAIRRRSVQPLVRHKASDESIARLVEIALNVTTL